jgi:hypothetical protein
MAVDAEELGTGDDAELLGNRGRSNPGNFEHGNRERSLYLVVKSRVRDSEIK